MVRFITTLTVSILMLLRIARDLVKVGALGGTLVNAVFEIVTVFPSCCPGFESAAGWGLGVCLPHETFHPPINACVGFS